MNNLKPVNILLVEDDEIDIATVRRAFTKAKIANTITEARDGLEALTLLRSGGVPVPKIILLDINMPRMDGIEFLKELRSDEQLKSQIVFVLTTSKTDRDKMAVYGYNVAGYMTKNEVAGKFNSVVTMLDCYWRVVEMPVGVNYVKEHANSDSR
jgi:CheY-like chemotaxis protein